MANLLIVDDENYVIEDLKRSMDWEKLGIDKIFTANSVSYAKEIFNDNTINIMICDIEMPEGSGLELLAWVQEKYPRTVTIFLTCHADFKYAKEALRLGGFDYILKPVPYDELEVIIVKAMEKSKKDTVVKEHERYVKFWFKHQPLLIERFWLDIINHEVPLDLMEIKKTADRRNIPFAVEMKVLPVMISVQRWCEEQSLHDEKILEFGLKNIAEEMIAAEGNDGIFIQIRRGGLLGILSSESVTVADRGLLNEVCCKYISICNQYMHCDLSCYIGEHVYAQQLPAMVDKLLNQEKDNVAFYNRVFLSDAYLKCDVNINTADLSLWSGMISDGEISKVVSGVEKYLNNLARTTGLDFQMMYQFQQDFNQMIYSHLEGKGIRAHRLLSDNKSVDLYIKAANSVKHMLEWVRHVVSYDVEYSIEVEKSQSVVNKVKKYLFNNLDEELTREDIANQVYLNPDYLDRIFKKEIGVSVKRFILQERIAMAKELLARTDTPVSVIAESVGYSKLSNFSAMFKKECGVNPIDYRKKNNM